MDFDYQRVIDWADDHIVNRPGTVLAAFLLVTAVFAVGLGNVQTAAGTEQFTQDIPAENALQAINQQFGSHFGPDTGSTQLIQRDANVLSKHGLLRMLRVQQRIEEHPGLRVASTSSAASIVARTLDPNATTRSEQIDAVERATPGQIDAAVRTAADRNPEFVNLLSNDFNRKAASASATIGVVSHDIPTGLSTGAGTGGSSPLTPIQEQIQFLVATSGGDITVFGSGIISAEFSNVILDTMLIVVPAAVFFIILFLVIAYRDLVDLLIGVVALAMAIVWTFGFMGLAGIAFNQILIAVPPLMLAVGIDYGIHTINRYREERVEGYGIDEGMRRTTDQLLVAFFIVTMTTVVGFLANVTSALAPIRDFGVVAAIGITFTFLIFGVFVPAAKVFVDRSRDRFPIPTFSQEPMGAEGSRLGSVLQVGVIIGERAPAIFLVLVLLVSAGAGAYATGVDTSFTQEDFLPPAHTPAYLKSLPEPFRPHDYSVVGTLNYLEAHFDVVQGDTVTLYVQGDMERADALESIHRAGRDPPASFIENGRQAQSTSIISVIQSRAQADPQFARLVARNDRNGNGIPDQHLGEIYDALENSPASAQAANYLTDDRRAAKVVYQVKPDASQREITTDAQTVTDRYRLQATATGNTVVFQAIADLILNSAIQSLALAILGTVIFLVLVFWLIEGRPSLGVANTIPILVTVATIAGTIRLAGISFNAFTATILAITIGLGIDYSVHVVHRFADEYHEYEAMEAIRRTVQGTGGALTGSMLTTVFGIGVLMLALFPAIGQFGLLTALSIFYSYVASLVVAPSVLILWARFEERFSPTPSTTPAS